MHISVTPVGFDRIALFDALGHSGPTLSSCVLMGLSFPHFLFLSTSLFVPTYIFCKTADQTFTFKCVCECCQQQSSQQSATSAPVL